MGSDNSQGTQGTKSLERALRILDIITAERWVGAKELADRVGLHRSSMYRILALLQRWGYVRQDPQTLQYGLGWHLLVMADHIDLYQELPRLARPYLEELMQLTRETTHLMTLDGSEVYYLAKVESPETIRMHSRVGARMPACTTAGGKVLLASLPPARRERVVRSAELRRKTANTITDPDELLALLDQVARQGWAADYEENEEGVCCIAAPVTRPDGSVVAAVTVSCPLFRTPRPRLEGFIPAIRATADKISDLFKVERGQSA